MVTMATPGFLYGCVLVLSIVLAPSNGEEQDMVYDIYEEEPQNFLIGTLATDLSLTVSSSASFQILGDVTLFSINSQSELRTTQVIDREDVCAERSVDDCKYDLTILLSDGSTQVLRIRVNVNDTNDNYPTFPYPSYALEVSESASVGAILPMQSALDADVGSNGIRTYELADTFNGMFDVVVTNTVDGAKTVHLRINQQLDRELEDTYTLVLRALDSGRPHKEGSATVNLRVLDANDNSPQFTSSEYSKSVFEDVRIGYEILNLDAEDIDQDTNAVIEYSFSESVTAIVVQLFEIDTDSGVLRTRAVLDHETNDLFVIIVQAQDKGQNSVAGYTTVTITVLDVNDNSPLLDIRYSDVERIGNTIYIPESVTREFFIGLLIASDQDSGENGQFEVSLAGTRGHFALTEDATNQFFFVTEAGIDREIVSEYNITIKAEDNGDPPKSSIRHVIVIVTDVNDNVPYFTTPSYMVGMTEHNDIGQVVTSVIAMDNDEGLNSELIYSLVTGQGMFAIDPRSGEIIALVSIDRESSASVDFIVSVCDKGTPQRCTNCTVTVDIHDQNDNIPYFITTNNEGVYRFSIDENMPKETLIGEVTATDMDSGVNGELTYSLSGSSEIIQKFYVNSENGRIYSKKPYDHEGQKHYQLTIVVNDGGLPSEKNEVTVHVDINDLNDNAPMIVFPRPDNDTFFIPSTALSRFWITDIVAIDRDGGRNGIVTYSISEGDTIDTFQILDNGTVMTKKELNKNFEGVYDLKINVKDSALMPKSSNAILTIVIANKEFSETLRPDTFFILFNETVNDYRLLKVGYDDGIDWPLIIVIALGGVAFILFIVFCILVARCHKKDKMEHTYKVPKEEELFQAGKVSVDGTKKAHIDQPVLSSSHQNNGTPASYVQSKNIMKWKMQSPDGRLGNKQMLTFNSNSDLNTGSNPSLASTRNTHDADAEVQRLLYKLKNNDTDSVSSNSEMDPSSDSGHGDSEHDAYGRLDAGRNHPRNALKNANRNTYMASPHCTPDCKILGHSDMCWMPDPNQDPVLLAKQRQNYHNGNYGPRQNSNTNNYLSTFDPGENVRMTSSCPQIASTGCSSISSSSGRSIEDPEHGRVKSPGAQALTPIHEDPRENSDLDFKSSSTIDGKVTFHRERGNRAPISKNYENFPGRSSSCSTLPQSSVGLIRNDSGLISSGGTSSDNLACSAINGDPDDLCSYSTVTRQSHQVDPTYDADKLTPTTEKLFFSEWV